MVDADGTSGRAATSRDGFRIAYDVVGEGDPLVLLPGLAADAARWRNAGYVDRLAARRRLVLIDPLGHGRSDRPHDPAAYDFAALAGHTTAVLDAEGVEVADVWGYSRGALLLVALMEHAGQRIRTAVAGGVDLTALVGGPASGDRSTAVALLREGDWPRFWEAFPTDVPRHRRAEVERDNDPRALAAAVEAAGTVSITVDPTTFHAMVYVGDGESFAQTTAEIAGLLGLRCAVLPTGDHVATFDAADEVCAAVEPFLDES